MRRSWDARVGRVFLRTLGSTIAARINSASRSSASRRFCSWLRALRALMRMLPSSFSFCPARRRNRFLTDTGKLVLTDSKNRNCTALATLLTFWPPGPEERMNFHANSSSGIAICGAMTNGMRTSSVALHARAEHSNFALRYRYRDLVLLEQRPNSPIDVGAHVIHALLRIGNPKTQLQFDAVV